MKTPTQVAGFVAALAAVFGLSLGVGKVIGPDTQSMNPSPSLVETSH